MEAVAVSKNQKAAREGGPLSLLLFVRSAIDVKVTSYWQPKGNIHQIKVGV